MYRHILVTLDGTPASEQALKQAIALAQLSSATLTGISVIEKLPAYAASLGEVAEAKAEGEVFFAKLQANAVESARASHVEMATEIRAGHSVQVILHYCEEGGFDLVIVGAEGRQGLGGTADRITEQAPCSVLVARSTLRVLRVRDVMTRDVAAVGISAPLTEVVDLLLHRGIKAVPVAEGRRVIGIITGGDLLERGGMGLRLSLQRLLSAEELAEQKRQLASSGKTAADVMTLPVLTIGENEKVTQAARIMAERQVKRLPVVDKEGSLVGIISRLDVLETFASHAQGQEGLPTLPKGLLQTAADVMFHDVATVSPETSLNEVLNRIVSTPLRRVIVVDETRRVLGMISDADLLERAATHPSPGFLRQIIAFLARPPAEVIRISGSASEAMEKDVYTVQSTTPLSEIARIMTEKRVKRIVVVDDSGRLLGMVDRESILRVAVNGLL